MAASVRLLGTPAVRGESGWLELPPGKLSAILVYLACQDHWVSRDDLLYLFWPDTPEQGARQNLRPLLSKLRRLPHAQSLEVEPARLRWPVKTDLRAFRWAVDEGRLAEAVELYGGELLKGFALESAPEFESWLELERGALQGVWREAVLSRAKELAGEGRHAAAAELLVSVCRADPLDETVLRHYLSALHAGGERAKALAAFTSFRETLQDELELEPDAATLRLVARLRAGEDVLEGAGPDAPAARPRPQPEGQATPFIGRRREREGLAALLSDPACRLITLCGPGGIGKTRLALEAAREQRGFPDGVWVVSCETVSTADAFVPALAAALDIRLGHDPKAQLLDALRGKEMLLVLDNLEHLLDVASTVAELLAAAPGVKVLATSRARLELQAEWVFDLGGLSYPERDPGSESVQNLWDYDAVRLFMQAARQARAAFAAAAATLQAAARIARRVEGMPLALELAAAWVRVLPPTDIATQLETDTALLEAETKDLPARHRSMRAVFAQTWALLSSREREVLRGLAVFRGGFSREAAEAVAGASLPLLLALVNKSLLRYEADGRFTMHPLLAEFAAERARAHPEERTQTEERHGGYFIDFLHARESALHTPRERAAAEEIAADIANVEAAWRWAAAQGREAWLDRALGRLCWFYFSRGWLERCLVLLRSSVEAVPDGSVVHGRHLQWIGAFLYHGGRFEEGVALLKRSVAIFERHGAKEPLAFVLRGLGTAYGRMGGHAQESIAAFTRALALYRELGDPEGVAITLMAPAYHAKDPAESERLLREGLLCARGAGLSRPLAMTLDCVAELHLYRTGDYPAAKVAIDECLACFAETGELLYRVAASGLQLRVRVALGEDAVAERQARELLVLAETLEPKVALQVRADALVTRGRLAYLRGEFSEARALGGEAHGLGMARFQRFSLEPLELLARTTMAQKQLDEAAKWLDEAWARLGPQPMQDSFEMTAATLVCMGLRGDLAARLGDARGAARRLREALELAYAWGYVPMALELLVLVAQRLERRDEGARAADLLALAASHPASPRAARAEAQRLLGDRAPEVDARVPGDALIQVAEVLQELV